MYNKPANRLPVHRPYTYGPDPYELKDGEGRDVYCLIVLGDDLASLTAAEDKTTTLAIQLLTPEDRRLSYCTVVVDAKLSSDPLKYKDRLHVRYQRGLLHPRPWSIEIGAIREELLVAPEGKFRT